MIECSSKNEKIDICKLCSNSVFFKETLYLIFIIMVYLLTQFNKKKKRRSCACIESLILFTAIISSLLRVKDVSKFRFYIISYEMSHFTKRGNNNPLRI